MLRRFMRNTLISLSKAGWSQRTFNGWGVARRVARRFVAGETLAEAIAVVQALNERGIAASLNFLGENTTTPAEAGQATAEMIRALEAIEAAGVRASLSLKLSQLGQLLDQELCCQNLGKVLTRARALNNFVRMDMEDSPLVEPTLAAYEWARGQGFDNLGVVLQAYLYRTPVDLERVLAQAGRVRLCKGAYMEPAAVAYPQKKDVDASYDRLATQLIEGALRAGAPQVSQDGRMPPIPAIATHDETRIRFVQAEARRLEVPRGALEFQMIYGIRRDLQEELARQGFPLRIYVPYGTHWYPYFMRRLAERPANLWFFLSNFFR
jgi:proline dehydrogenase